MKMKQMTILLGFALILTACSGFPFNLLPEDTPVPSLEPQDDPTAAPESPVSSTPDQSRPLPQATPTEKDNPRLLNGEAYVDHVDFRVMESYPVQPVVTITGNLPTPCHSLRVDIQGPDANNIINIELSSVQDPGKLCADVLEPFETSLRMDLLNLQPGLYTVYVESDEAGTFTYP